MTTALTTVSVTPMIAEKTAIDGLWLIQMKEVKDGRGIIREFYRESAFVEAGLPSLGPWLQMNVTESSRGVVRGLHGEDMHKLVAIIEGEAFGTYVDARPASPTYGAVVTAQLTKGKQVLVPKGVCNGFQSVSDQPSQYLYCFDAEWVPGMAGTSLHPLSDQLGIAWPIPVDRTDTDLISEKDLSAPERLPRRG
ncbi:dTDP-4-dehydrorhamnose 3,5-epimerase [Rhizocola hellebori]|uniref:dTDP-4-dehydrorhamnose 3,5-epimerase n=1 Tax=Rhizocola hellebori TaxID=1392758 RepID=A0A8J3Q7U7_9ACTN|nr:dTDP-4-dehydrorhamnose 3,5-epimerase family protein [Rhizocola hellebori]GIH04670.1 dTDP-4-dehydrorhamnose 3,5-epimerase [Rhizocola hellebori]